jgi:hypothetical protein
MPRFGSLRTEFVLLYLDGLRASFILEAEPTSLCVPWPSVENASSGTAQSDLGLPLKAPGAAKVAIGDFFAVAGKTAQAERSDGLSTI